MPDRSKLFFAFLSGLLLMTVLLMPLDPDKKISQYMADKWELEQGLPQNTVQVILQSRSGYLWIGTQSALVRFDGERFDAFDHKNVPGMPKGWIWALHEDRAGNLWAGSFGGGLYRLENGDISSFSRIEGLSDDLITAILEDREGRVWVGTMGGGLNRLDSAGGAVRVYNTGNGLADDKVWALCEDREGVMWIGTENGLNRLEPGNDTFSLYTKEQGLCGNVVHTIHEDRDGRLWVGTGSGLNRREAADGAFISFTTADGLSENAVRTITHDRDGNLWVGTWGGGVNRLDFRNGRPSVSVFSEAEGLSNNMIWSIFEDREKGLWIGTHAGGLNRLRDGKFTVFGLREGLGSDSVKSIYEDRHGNVWFGADGGGLSRLDGTDGSVSTYTVRDGLSNNHVLTIFGAGDGWLYIGTDSGLDRLDIRRDVPPAGGSFTAYDPRGETPLNNNGVIYQDRRGLLWMGSYTGGLTRIDFRGGAGPCRNFTTKDGLPSNNIWTIHEDRGGNLWIGTYGGGLVKMTGGAFTVYTVKDGLPGNFIMSIYEDERDALWISTTKGLCRMKDGRYDVVNSEQGLFSDGVHQIMDDGAGNYWMSSNHGIFHTSKQELNDLCDGKIERIRCTAYDEKDGMRSRECNGGIQPCAWKSRDGRLWFPTIRGAVVVNPAHINAGATPPPVKIEAVRADDTDLRTPLRPGDENLVIPPEVNRLSIRYTALSFPAPERVRFKYKLEGYDRDWVDVGNLRTAYFTSLPSGNYVFRVKACNNDGVWNETGASISFYREPYFYQTPWFHILMILVVLFLVVSIYRYRVNRIRKHEAELELLVEERTRESAEQREVAEAANRSKSDFLARMSHEIRTPMNGVIGFIEMLLETPLNEEQLEFAHTINRSGEALVDLVNDILDFSKVEAGELSLSPVDFDPELTAFDVCEIVLPRLGGKPVEVICRVGDTVPAYIRSDAGRFRQVLVNLVGNAAKFTEAGEIALTLDVVEEREDRLKLHVTVTDTGIGIAADKLDAVFDPFQQADAGTTRKYGGTGLGLPICKQIAALMEGDVRAESTPGQGSTFHFTAWVDRSQKEPETKFAHQHLTGKRVLVVDDNRTNLEISTHVLTRAGMRVTALERAADVIPAMRRDFDNGEPFDICVLDIRMPELSGYDLAKQIRRLPAPMSHVPLLAFSSSTIARSETFKESGFDGFLPKPVRRQKLLKMLERLLGKGDAGEDEPGESIITRYSIDEEAKHSVRILLAEDNPVNRKLAHFMLTRAGYHLTMVNNGEEAVAAYTEAPDGFDLILMDIQMPVMNGMDAARAIRDFERSTQHSTPNTQHSQGSLHIPIIAMTAESLTGDREKCLDCGMDDYIAKPIKREVVFAMVKKWRLTGMLQR